MAMEAAELYIRKSEGICYQLFCLACFYRCTEFGIDLTRIYCGVRMGVYSGGESEYDLLDFSVFFGAGIYCVYFL